MARFTFEASPPFQRSIAIDSPNARYQSNPFSNLADGFDLTWDLSLEDIFDFNNFEAMYQPESEHNPGPLDPIGRDLGSDGFTLNNMNFTCMDLTVAPPASSTVIETSHTVPDFFTWINQLFTQILPTVGKLFRNVCNLKEDMSAFRVERLCHPRTSQLLRKQSIDVQFLHLIIFRLVNNENALHALDNPQGSVDRLYKAGVQYLFSLEAHSLGEVLDSAATSYTTALEQGLFCAAVEMGVGKMVNAILERGLSPDRPFNFTGFKRYPLERSCAKRHVEVTRILIKFGADPNKHISASPLYILTRGYNESIRKPEEILSASLEILSTLLENGAMMEPGSVPRILISCESEMLPLLASGFARSSHEMFIFNGALASILKRGEFDDLALSATKIILEHNYPDGIRGGETWNEVLTASLSNAACNGKLEAIDLLLSMGAIPNSNCLISAVYSKKTEVLERFLDLGLDPNVLKVPTSDRQSIKYIELISKMSSCTAMSESIEQKCREAFQVFDQRGFLSTVGNSKDSFRLTLQAACEVGDEDLIGRLLSLGRCTNNLHQALTAAVKTGRESTVRRLLEANVIPNHEALFEAVKKRHSPLAELLVGIVYLQTRDADLEWHDILYEAVLWGNTTIIEKLIHAGVSLNNQVDFFAGNFQEFQIPDILQDGSVQVDWLATPLSAAIIKGNPKVIELLLTSGAQLNVYDPYAKRHENNWTMTALAASVVKEELGLVQSLLRRGADPFDNGAIYMAAALEEEDIIKALIDAFTQRYPYGSKSFGTDALFWAINTDNEWMVELLARSTDMHSLVRTYTHDDDLEYALMSPLGVAIKWASIYGTDSKLLGIMLQEGGDPDSIVCTQSYLAPKITALLYAIKLGSLETIVTLRKAGANLALPALWGIRRTPLQTSAEEGNEEIVDYLLQQGVDPNEPPAARAGATALQLAAIKGFVGIATTLLEAGANVNAEPAMIDGRTAFEGATEYGRIEMMLFLVHKGADLLSNNRQQYQRAIQFAEMNGHAAAKKFADQLFEAALRQNGTGTLGTEDVEMIL